MTSEPLVLGVDASTTACKVIAIDRSGTSVAEARATYPIANPQPGGWEQDPADWWSALQVALREVTRKLGARADAIDAIALACQRETFVAVDGQGEALHPAILWMDARSGQEVDAVRNELGEDAIVARSGKVPCTTPSLYKIRWLLERARPDLAGRTTRIADVHAFLAQKLTGAFVSSGCAADPMGMIDIETGAWDDALLGAALVDRTQVPRLAGAGEKAGVVLDDVADALGLPRGLPLIAGAGDGQAAGLGAGALEPGSAYLNVGTAIVAGRASDTPQRDRSYRTLIGPIARTWFLETDLLGGTFSLDWLARTCGAVGGTAGEPATWLAAREAEAASLAPGSGGLFFLPYLAGVMNPHWQADVGGAFLGLRADHGPAHLYRAILEGLAFEARAQLGGLLHGTSAATVVAVGGAMQRPIVARLFTDVLGQTVARSGVPETTALGAAALAAAGARWFPDARAAARAFSKPCEPLLPGPDAVAYDRLFREVAAGLFEALAPRLRALALARTH